MDTTVTNTTGSNDTIECIKISPEMHVDFNSVGDVAITTTNELAKVINDIFSQVFKDYYGCTMECNFQPDKQSYVIVPRLFFHVLKSDAYDDGYFAFQPLASAPKDDIIGRVQRLSKISSTNGPKVAITDNGKSVLEDFVIKPRGINNLDKEFDWDKAYDTIPTSEDTFIRVFKLDILKMLKMIYGDKNESGSPYYYQITPVAVIGANNQYSKTPNWGINILRLNEANEKAAAEQFGFTVQSQSANVPPIITAKTTK